MANRRRAMMTMTILMLIKWLLYLWLPTLSSMLNEGSEIGSCWRCRQKLFLPLTLKKPPKPFTMPKMGALSSQVEGYLAAWKNKKSRSKSLLTTRKSSSMTHLMRNCSTEWIKQSKRCKKWCDTWLPWKTWWKVMIWLRYVKCLQRREWVLSSTRKPIIIWKCKSTV